MLRYVLLPLLLGLAGLGAAFGQVPSAQEVGARLHAVAQGGHRGQAARSELVAMGTPAIPALFALVSGKERLPDSGQVGALTPRSIESQVVELLGSWNEEPTVLALRDAALASGVFQDRLTACRLLGNFGHDIAFDSMLELLGEAGPEMLRHPQIRSAVQKALGALFDRSPSTLRSLPNRIHTYPVALIPSLAAASVQSPNPHGLRLLKKLLGRDRTLDGTILDCLGSWPSDQANDELEGLVLPFMESSHSGLRCKAAAALGSLGAMSSVPDLISALGDEDRRVQASALRSLKCLTSKPFGQEQERWIDWQDQEADWLEGRCNVLLDQLEEGNRASCLIHLRELARHRLARDTTSPWIAELASHQDPTIAMAAISTLAQLGAPICIPQLTEASHDPRPQVATVALAALTQIHMNRPR